MDRFDVIVVGGGVAGVAAAYSASMQGDRVLLIEQRKRIGGLATNAEVGTICGIYANSNEHEFVLNAGKFTESLIHQMMLNGSQPISNREGLKYLSFSPTKLEACLSNLLDHENIEIRLGTSVDEVQVNDGDIQSIACSKNGESWNCEARVFVDASGDSVLSRLGAQEVIDVEEEQVLTQVFSLENVKYGDEQHLSLVLLKSLMRASLMGDIEQKWSRINLVPGSLRDGRVALKMTVPLNQSADFSLSQIQESMKIAISQLVDVLRKHMSGMESVVVKSIADSPGIRLGNRGVGRYVLNEQDVLECRKKNSFVARGNWPMEIWNQSKRVELKFLKPNDFYDIPAESLIAMNVNNLFFAGRCIAATDGAIASARVIGTCLQTGFAAGKLASGLRNKESLEAVVERLQNEQFVANA